MIDAVALSHQNLYMLEEGLNGKQDRAVDAEANKERTTMVAKDPRNVTLSV